MPGGWDSRLKDTLQRTAWDTRPCLINNEKYISFSVDRVINPSKDASGYYVVSLFGNNEERYFKPLVACIRRHAAGEVLISDWRFRIYISPKVPARWITELESLGVEICIMNRDTIGYDGTTWRFLALAQDKPFIIMEADDGLEIETLPRQIRYHKHVKDWLNSDKDFYYLEPLQKLLVPLGAGQFGARNKFISDIEYTLNEFCKDHNCYGCDEKFLKLHVYPRINARNTFIVSNNEYTKYLALPILLALLIFFLIMIFVYLFFY